MTEGRTQSSAGWSSALAAAAGTGSLALVAVASWSGLLLVVRGRVVPGWGVSATLLVVALLLCRALTRAGTAGLPRTWAKGTRLGNRLLIGAAVLGIVGGALSDLLWSARYQVLNPAGPGGCTAVVRETSFLMAGAGEAYAVGRTGLALGSAGSWTTDDGHRPVAAGDYELIWDRTVGVLRVDGTATDPILDGGATAIAC